MKGNYSVKMFLATILTGVIYAIVVEGFYQSAIEKMPGVLVIMFYFAGLFLILGLVVSVVGKGIYSSTSGRVNKKQWVITLLLIFALSSCFEFLYEIIQNKKDGQEISSYLFVMDDSGSMEVNDPNYVRYQAIDMLLESKPTDFSYGIISFNDDSTILRNIAPKSEGKNYTVPQFTGGTAIRGTLTNIRDAMENQEIVLDENCKVILLSDGYATDISVFSKRRVMKLLKYFSEKKVCISTVGLLNADESLMSLIADKTGGVFVRVDDISELETAMGQAAEQDDESRNLLGYRKSNSLNFLLGLMRILFVAVLGIIIAVEKTVLSERFIDTQSVLVSSTIGSILAALCIELGMNFLGFHPTIMRVITCALISFTLLRKDEIFHKGQGSGVKYAGR